MSPDPNRWKPIPDPKLSLTVIYSRPDGLYATTYPAPWLMPPDAVLWIQPGRAAWQPGPAHAFESSLPVRHETEESKTEADARPSGIRPTLTIKPASRSRKPFSKEIQPVPDVFGLG